MKINTITKFAFIFVITLIASLYLPQTVRAASGTCSSIATGNWSAVGTWGSGCSGANGQPIAGDTATISAGDTVTVDGAQAALKVTVANTGTLAFGGSSSLTLDGNSGTILTNNGSISAGTSSTVIFTGNTSPTALLSGSFTGSNAFYDLTLSPTISTAVSYYTGVALTVNNNLTIDPTSGASNALTLFLSGNLTVGGLVDIKGEGSATSVMDSNTATANSVGTMNIRLAGTFYSRTATTTFTGTTSPVFTRTGSFASNSSTIVFSQSSADTTLTSSAGSFYFWNVQINMSGRTGIFGGTQTTIAHNLTVAAGALNDGGHQIIGSAANGGILTVSSGAGLTLGSASAATAFPTNLDAAHISLNSAGTITYASNQAQTVSGVPTYGNLTISGSSTKSLGAATTVAGNLTISTGTLNDAGYQITGNATGTLSAASGANLTLGSATTATTFPTNFTNAHVSLDPGSTVIYASAQAQTISGVPTYGNLTVSAASTKSLGATTTAAGTVTLSAGTLALNGFDMSVGGDWTNNGAVFTPGSNTVTFSGTGAQAINGSATDQTFYGLTIAKTAGTTLSVSGSTTSLAVTNFTETTGNFTAPATIDINGNVTLTAGTYTAGTATTVFGNWANNGGTFTPGTNTVTFDGTGAQAINGSAASQTFYGLTLAKTAGTALSVSGSTAILNVTTFIETTGNFTAPATVNIAGNVTLSAGTYTSGANMNVAGNWTNGGGTFSGGTGTVTLNGANSSTQAISGNTTFNNLYASTAGNTAGRTIQYTSGSTTIVTGTWTMNGASGKILSLTPSSTTNWTITPTAALVDYVYLSRSTNTVGDICATHSTGDANNSGYTITDQASCTSNSAPATPTQELPIDTATNQSVTPELKLHSHDADSDYLEYKIILCEDVGMLTNCQTFDQTANQSGWSGQDANGGQAYASTPTTATTATYTISSALQNSKAYYWKSYAYDPAGTATWSTTQSSPFSFTTIAAPAAGTVNTNLKGINLKGLIVK